ncbi:MAG: ABC transporter ATP-binding protein/permease [Bacilli bacterium]|nr:ABC transporter ATP-binding protein/permease [Bacilli bacterium]
MLELRDITKTYVVEKQHFPALKGINLSLPDKGFVSILGPSGCGKTTLLNLIGGLDQYTSGDLIINNKSTKKFTDQDWDAYRNKRVGFVFQTYNLVPHLTVLGNVELSMTLTGMNKKERQSKATTALDRVGLKDTLKKKPNQLSGGQMQRVAIARSLVNDPEIILADEPTGALDSVTSVQVMEILKEVAKDRLVVMVTHNNELAEKYSTRIIRLKDGLVISDTEPLNVVDRKDSTELEQEQNKHTHMSFLTALGSSAKSLLTKKGRTIMTAVAASFGIIGVALVLAMSNGFQNYVNRVESETASSVPITISPFVTTQIKQMDLPEAWPSEEVIKPYDEDISQVMVIHRNYLTKEYSNYAMELLEGKNHYASSVLENHEYLDFNIFAKRESGEVIKVDQFQSAGATGSILSGVTNLPSTIFHELYGGRDYIESLYDVVKGTYPKELNEDDRTVEVCLVCDRYNRVPMKTLYALGLSDSSLTQEGQTIDFNDIINSDGYKAYSPKTLMEFLKSKGQFKEIDVPKEERSAFSDAVPIETDKEIPILKDITIPGFTTPPDIEPKTPKITLYGNIADETPEAAQARKDLFDDDVTNKPIKIKISGIIRPKRDTLINLMPGSICYPASLKKYYVNKLSEDYKEYAESAKNNYYITAEAAVPDPKTIDLTDYGYGEVTIKNYQPAAINLLAGINYAYQGANTTPLTTLLDDFTPGTSYFRFFSLIADKYKIEDLNNFSELTNFATPNYSRSYTRGNYRFASEFDNDKIKMFSAPIPLPIVGTDKIVLPVKGTYGNQLNNLVTYCSGYSTITSVLVFPRSLSDKSKVFEYLDAYNKDKIESAQILYSDLAGNLTEALGTMIDIISIVLVVFSSVSLLVSCVMTGIITYTSVLERTKEIGILRAIGARKKDVGRLFEAESVIIGGVAGLAGVLFTFIVEWPISAIINSRFPDQQIGMICNLNPWHAVLLVVISILLTFISGFIPARKAAKKDPVVALRTE